MADEPESPSRQASSTISRVGTKVAEHIPPSSEIVLLIKPYPSLAIIKFIPGIIEIIARACSMGIILILFIASSVASDAAANNRQNAYAAGRAAAGWVFFLGIVSIIYEASFLLTRFFHCGFTTIHRKIYLIVDVVVSFVLAFGFFIGLVSLAAGASTAAGDETVRNSLGAAAFFSFVSMCPFVFLGVWSILYLVFQWDIKGMPSHHEGGGEGGGGHEDSPDEKY
jgi:hypothetical protein